MDRQSRGAMGSASSDVILSWTASGQAAVLSKLITTIDGEAEAPPVIAFSPDLSHTADVASRWLRIFKRARRWRTESWSCSLS